jgi:hypothetical protein
VQAHLHPPVCGAVLLSVCQRAVPHVTSGNSGRHGRGPVLLSESVVLQNSMCCCWRCFRLVEVLSLFACLPVCACACLRVCLPVCVCVCACVRACLRRAAKAVVEVPRPTSAFGTRTPWTRMGGSLPVLPWVRDGMCVCGPFFALLYTAHSSEVLSPNACCPVATLRCVHQAVSALCTLLRCVRAKRMAWHGPVFPL